MKRFSLFALLGASLILVGCGAQTETETNTTTETGAQTSEFTAAVCNDYFNVLDCTLKTQVPADQQAEQKLLEKH